MGAVSRTRRVAFWILLAMLSVFFAEVVSGSFIFPYVHPWGLCSLLPLYGLHTVLLAYLVFCGRPRLHTLLLAGFIFGLYEAYVTFVLFDPPWGDALLKLGGVAVVEFAVVTLFWHPWMSFIVPLLVGEALLTGSSEVIDGFPAPVRRFLLSRRFLPVAVLLGVWGGIIHGSSATPLLSVLSSLSTGVPLLLLVWLWRRGGGAGRSMRDMLPTRGESLVLLALLLLYFLVMFLVMSLLERPGSMPPWYGHVIIFFLYGAFFALLVKSTKSRSPDREDASTPPPSPPKVRRFVMVFCVFSLTSLVTSLVWFAASFFGIGQVPICLAASWLVWVPAGVSGLVYAVFTAVRE